MAQILVTGGAGFIGSHLVRALIENDHVVRVIDDLSTGSLDNLEGMDLEFQQSDICDPAGIANAVRGVNAVFHLAAFISAPDSVDQPEVCYRINVMGSLNVLKAAQQAGVRRVVLASSAAIYGDAPGPIAEDAQKNPASPYAVSKLAMEETAQLFARTYGLETVSLRFFNVYGPRQSPDSPYAAVIPQFIQELEQGRGITILGDGQQTRDFVYVRDVAQACMRAMEAPSVAGGVYNIAGGSSISILELAGILHGFYVRTPEVQFGPSRPGDVRFSQARIEQARTALGYHPEIALEQGLADTIEWFKSSRT